MSAVGPSSRRAGTNGSRSFPHRKRRHGDRDRHRTPAGGNDGDGEGNDDYDEDGRTNRRNQNSGTGQSPRGQKDQSRFLCPFNLFNPDTHNSASCAGPGWSDLRYLKEHLQRSHRVYRCSRCGLDLQTCEKLGDHLMMIECLFDCQACLCQRQQQQQPGVPLCEPSKEEGPPKEVPFFKWQLVELVLTKSDDKQRGLSDVERYEKLWNILFPSAPVPRNPYSRRAPFDPGEMERAKRQIFQDKIKNNPETAKLEPIVMAILREADTLVGKHQQQPLVCYPFTQEEISPGAEEATVYYLDRHDSGVTQMVPTSMSSRPESRHRELEAAVVGVAGEIGADIDAGSGAHDDWFGGYVPWDCQASQFHPPN